MKWKRKKAKNIEKKKINNRKRKESSQMLKFSKNDAHMPLRTFLNHWITGQFRAPIQLKQINKKTDCGKNQIGRY